jgi:hypothetical protein
MAIFDFDCTLSAGAWVRNAHAPSKSDTEGVRWAVAVHLFKVLRSYDGQQEMMRDAVGTAHPASLSQVCRNWCSQAETRYARVAQPTGCLFRPDFRWGGQNRGAAGVHQGARARAQ